jgi:hypothetical protein
VSEQGSSNELFIWAAVAPNDEVVAAPFDTEEQVRQWAACSIDERYRSYRPVKFIPAHEPATELSDDFRKGVRAVFDSLLCRAANNYHGNPDVNASCTEENKIVTAWAADALAEVSVDDWNEWVSITDLRRENDELKAQVRAAPPPGAEFQEWIEQWAEAYPLDVFPKPDLYKARDVLAAASISLDCISADAMRHVITKVRDRMRATSTKGGEL